MSTPPAAAAADTDNEASTAEQVPDASGWFGTEVHAHDSHLRRYLRRAFPTVRDLDDVMQESYLRLWKAKTGAPIVSARALLFQVAKRLAIDVLRRRRTNKIDAVEDLTRLNVIDEKCDVVGRASLKDDFIILARAFDSLPPRCREVMRLRKIQGLAQKEIADRLGIAEGTVQVHVVMGLRKLEQYFEEHGGYDVMKPQFSMTEEAVKQAAAEWMARKDAGLSSDEGKAFARWRDADPRHAKAWEKYEALWSDLDGPRSEGVAEGFEKEMSAVARRRRSRKLATAGGGLALLVAAAWVWQRSAVTTESELPSHVSLVGPERATLPDGTIVEYPTGSVVRADYADRAARRVTLEKGEAHFQVAKDASRPFVVRAGSVDVRAVGTAFSVNLAQAAIEVLVTDGAVSVRANNSSQPVSEETLAKAGERVTFKPATPDSNRSPAFEQESVSVDDLAQKLLWRQRRMEFSRTPLSEVIEAINRATTGDGRPRFELAEKELGAMRLTGSFRPDDTDAVVAILRGAFGLQVERIDQTSIKIRKL